jgi:hypothetical protein
MNGRDGLAGEHGVGRRGAQAKMAALWQPCTLGVGPAGAYANARGLA